MQNQESFFNGTQGYSSSDSSDFSDDSFDDGSEEYDEMNEVSKPKLQAPEPLEESKRLDTVDLSESEEEHDELARMLMKSSAKSFNHVNCN